MKTTDITMVRIYCTEAEHKLKPLLTYLHDEAQVRGVTVFRAISGFGRSGKIHEAGWTDLSLDLPLVVEFFDVPDKIMAVLEQLNTQAESGHVVFWQGQMNG
jgi:hypothetical protein